LTALEDQAAGCPVIALNGSAEADLCPIGWRIAFLEAAPGSLAAAYQLSSAPHSHTLRRMAHEKALLYEADRVMALCLAPALARIEREMSLAFAEAGTDRSRKGVVREKNFAQ
jgi:hypothetical protein